MSMYHEPWRLVPNHIRGQGGREIDRFRGIAPALDTSYGSEAWIGSVTRVEHPPAGHPDYGCSEVLLPDGRQMYLYRAIELAPDEILGLEHQARHGRSLGMLIKYLDAQRQYGLQCHPTRAWAKSMWGSPYGKEESWYVLSTRDDTSRPAYILLGFREGVTRQMWEERYYARDLAGLEALCHRIEVHPGETYFVGGGCPHALGEGCFVIEVQEPSDITLGALPVPEVAAAADPDAAALYDRRLLGAYVYSGCSREENFRRWRIPPQCFRQGGWGEESILIGPEQTSYFSFTRLTVRGKEAAPLRNTGFPQIAIVTKGEGRFVYGGGAMPLQQADEVFLPYAVPKLRAEGELEIILCHPEGVRYETPDGERQIGDPL